MHEPSNDKRFTIDNSSYYLWITSKGKKTIFANKFTCTISASVVAVVRDSRLGARVSRAACRPYDLCVPRALRCYGVYNYILRPLHRGTAGRTLRRASLFLDNRRRTRNNAAKFHRISPGVRDSRTPRTQRNEKQIILRKTAFAARTKEPRRVTPSRSARVLS